MTDQVFQTSYVEPVLDKDAFQREVALDRAVSFHKEYGGDALAVVDTAEVFRQFLAAATTAAYKPKHAAGGG